MKLGNSNINKIYIGSNEINKAYLGSSLVYDNSGGGAFDSDAQAFINAIGTLDANQQNAINNLVLGFKASGSWSQRQAIYPMIGGSYNSHKFNLKDPRDLDVAFRLQEIGGTTTHSNLGIVGQGGRAFNTFYIPSINGITDSTHLEFYAQTTENGNNQAEMGRSTSVSGTTARMQLEASWAGNSLQFDSYHFAGGRGTASSGGDARGLSSGTRNGFNDIRVFKNGVQVGFSATDRAGVPPNQSLYLMAVANSTDSITNTSLKTCSFSSIGLALTPSQVTQDYTTIQNYQTALGRAV